MYFTYIAYFPSSDKLTVGVTMNLLRRKKILCTQDNGCRIVFLEQYDHSRDATRRENELLSLPKSLLKELIDETNPLWLELVKTPGNE